MPIFRIAGQHCRISAGIFLLFSCDFRSSSWVFASLATNKKLFHISSVLGVCDSNRIAHRGRIARFGPLSYTPIMVRTVTFRTSRDAAPELAVSEALCLWGNRQKKERLPHLNGERSWTCQHLSSFNCENRLLANRLIVTA